MNLLLALSAIVALPSASYFVPAKGLDGVYFATSRGQVYRVGEPHVLFADTSGHKADRILQVNDSGVVARANSVSYQINRSGDEAVRLPVYEEVYASSGGTFRLVNHTLFIHGNGDRLVNVQSDYFSCGYNSKGDRFSVLDFSLTGPRLRFFANRDRVWYEPRYTLAPLVDLLHDLSFDRRFPDIGFLDEKTILVASPFDDRCHDPEKHRFSIDAPTIENPSASSKHSWLLFVAVKMADRRPSKVLFKMRIDREVEYGDSLYGSMLIDQESETVYWIYHGKIFSYKLPN